MAKKSKAAKAQSNYTNANSLLGYNQQMIQHEANILNDQNMATLRDKLAEDAYNRDVDLQNLQFQNQLEAFDRSEQAFHQGLGMIDEATQLAYDQENLLLDQKLKELAFSKSDLDRGWLQTQLESQFAMQQLQLKDETEEATFASNSKAASIDQKQKAADAKYEYLQASMKGDAEAGQANAAGRRGTSARKANNSAVMQASMDKGKIASDLYNGSLSYKNTASSLSAQRKLGMKGRASEQKNIESMLGISAEQFTSDTKQLGKMLRDQFKQSEYNMSKIELKGFNTKAQLYEARPLPPKKPPALPKPYKTPTTNYVKPLPPVHASKGVSGGYGGGSPSSPSTASSLMGFAGLGLTAGAMAFGGPIAAGAGALLTGLSSLF
jgi:hypothetical protein